MVRSALIVFLLAVATPAVCAVGCFPPPEGPLVEGPTLRIEVGTVSEAEVAGAELVVAAPLDDEAQTAHGDFLAVNQDTIGPQRLVALRGARVRLRPGAGVDELADAFGGLTIFVAPEGDPAARVFLASAVAPASVGPVELAPIASRLDYEQAQAVLTAPRFVVGIAGPTPFSADRTFELGLRIELELAIIEIIPGGAGH
jgi:hypothetical protein